MAYWCHHGWYPRTFGAREAARERQGDGTHHERRDDKKIPPEHQAVLELRTDEVASGGSVAAHGVEC